MACTWTSVVGTLLLGLVLKSSAQDVLDATTTDDNLAFQPMKGKREQYKYHGRYTVFDEKRITTTQDEALPEFDIKNLKQAEPPWSYHGGQHPGKWHKINNERFMVPQIENWDVKDWGYTEMRFMPRYNEIAVEDAKKDFQKLTRLLPIKKEGDVRLLAPYFMTSQEFRLILKHAGLRTQSSVNMSPNMIFRYHNIVNRLELEVGDKWKILTKTSPTKDCPDMKDNFKNKMMEVLNACNFKIKVYETKPAEGKSYNVLDDRNIKFLYTLALEHAQDLSNGEITNTRDRNARVRKPHFILDPKGDEWVDHFNRFGLDTETNYCWWNEQSPIDINPKTAEDSSFTEYDYGPNAHKFYKFQMYLQTDATTLLTIKLLNSNKAVNRGIRLSGGAITGPDLYLDRIFVKYGSSSGNNNYSRGTEHTIEGKGYGMELQFVFTLEGENEFVPYYLLLGRSLRSWKRYREKLVMIISVLVEVVKKPEKPKNKDLFEPLSEAAKQFTDQAEQHNPIQYRGFVSKHNLFRMIDFIPDSLYYVYRGSLTHPPCLPYVMWSVYEDRLQISEDQYRKFLNIPARGFDDEEFVAGNVRHTEQIRSELEDPGRHRDNKAILKNRYLRIHRLVSKSLHFGAGIKGTGFEYYDEDSAKQNICSLLSITSCLLLGFFLQFILSRL